MGLSSSQARLLSLTGRMHDIEYKAQKLEAQKLQLANETRRVNEDYLNALDMIKIQSRTLAADGSSTYIDATYNNLIYSKDNVNSIYVLRDIESGKVYCSNEIRSAFVNSDRTIDGFLKTLNSLRTDKSSYTSITSAADLMAMSGSSGNFRLDADLVLDNWAGITNFSGTFDGNGHTITINNSQNGLFNTIDGGTVRNVELDVDINNTTTNHLGALAGSVKNATIENCSATGEIDGNRWIGGLVGYTLGNTTFRNSTASVDISCNLVDPTNGVDNTYLFYVQSCSGGFIGGNAGTLTVEDCRSEGDISSEYSIIGGFMGTSIYGATIKNCVSIGNVTANRSGLADTSVYNYTVNHSRSNMYPSGTFLGACQYPAQVSIENCVAYGMPTNEGSVDSCYFDFGSNYSTTTVPTTVNSYSRYSGDIIASTSVAVSSDVTSSYANIDSADIDYLVGMFNVLKEAGGGYVVDEDCANNPQWLSNMVTNGFAMLATFEVKSGRLMLDDTSVAVDTNLREVSNEIELKKAEAKYEADMKRIDRKDSKYDTDLAAIEAERNAIKQEMETLKTVAKDNVERTFKLFS